MAHRWIVACTASAALLFSGASASAQHPHWAYRPVHCPTPPDAGVHPIDAFIAARLDRAGIEPSPRAGVTERLRRLHFALTGLPPTLEAVRNVEADGTLDDVAVLDELLASDAASEHRTRHWLDLARYADTRGFEADRRRPHMWRYRDQVLAAFARNQPYDQFVVEQLAGDLLPDATVEQRVATAFHRNTMTNDEGGTDDEEFRCEAVVDRVDTTMAAFMGTTMACARCHDHKHDPFTQREYYGLFAFFNQTADADRNDDGPRLPAPSVDQSHELAAIATERAAAEAEVDADAAQGGFYWWRRSATGRHAMLSPSSQHVVPSPWQVTAAQTHPSFARAFEECADGPPDGAEFEPGRFDWNEAGVHALRSPDNSVRYLRRTIDVRVILPEAALALGSDDAIRVWFNGERIFSKKVTRGAAANQDYAACKLKLGKNELTIAIVNGGGPSGFYCDLRAFPVPRRVLDKLFSPRPETDEELFAAWRSISPLFDATRDRLAELDERERALAIPNVPVMQELPSDRRRTTWIFERGSFLARGDEVQPHTPAALHPFPEDAPRNRLGLARWIVDPRNPLFARVAANRVWTQMFGRGLVERSEDWGTQGDRPSHPDLLDWLASEFVSNGHDVHALIRTVATSATFQRSAAPRPDLRDIDPDNRLYARGVRVRLDGEELRDAALRASGLLHEECGGPSVMPVQPEGVWQIIYSDDRWTTSEGEDRYRRALYTFWRRTSPYPSFEVFDAPTREACTPRRVRTNTPLQALALLNDPVFVECAAALAARAGDGDGDGDDSSDRAFVDRVWQATLSRSPSAAERTRALRFLDEDTRARLDAQSPDDLAGPASDAARVALCSLVLNLEEASTR